MEKTFTPIAMACTKEQFETLGIELTKHYTNSRDFIDYDFLFFDGKDFFMQFRSEKCKLYETFDKETFLKSCGIETEKTYKITKETILKYEMKKEFPELFEVELVVGEWYNGGNHLFCYQEGQNVYGFNSIGWEELSCGGWSWEDKNVTKASTEEIQTALINESKKRGFVKGVYFKDVTNGQTSKIECSFRYLEFGCLKHLGQTIFENGKWATIIPTLTKKQAEEKLNCKII